MTTSSFQVSGRCECGGVRYRVSGAAAEVYHCHCGRCRRLHGTLFATYAYVLRQQIAIDAEPGALNTYRSPRATWHFCGTCGCHLFAEHEHNPGIMWYMPATLEQGETPGHPPESEKHIFTASASSLEPLSEDLPRYDGYAPPEDSLTSRRGSER